MFNNAKNGVLEVDDTTINYLSFGKGSRNLILIPGLGDGFKTVKGLAIPFSLMYKKFTKDFTIYSFSRKNKLSDGYTTLDMANDVIKCMNKLGIEKASILGVSQGGMISQHIAINFQERVEKLVLVVTVPKSNNMIDENIDIWLNLALKKDFKEIMLDTAKKSYTGKYLKKNIRVLKYFSFLMKPRKFDRFIIQANACKTHDSKEIEKIKCPTLIIGGRKDEILGVDGSIELNKKIEGSILKIYDEYSHGLYEQAKDFNDKVLEFLK
jgi:pimeloyl-ACP methyl ester carboxylesterase